MGKETSVDKKTSLKTSVTDIKGSSMAIWVEIHRVIGEETSRAWPLVAEILENPEEATYFC